MIPTFHSHMAATIFDWLLLYGEKMEFFCEIAEEKYEQYRRCQHTLIKAEPDEIGQVWSDRICVSVFDCGNCLSIEISIDDLAEVPEYEILYEFTCSKDMRNVSFGEFQATLKGFIEDWVNTYALVLKEPVLERDFSITRENRFEEELDEYELER